jgi:putative transposase
MAGNYLSNNSHIHRKSSYSTTFIFRFKAGILNSDELRIIPRSTRHEWKNRSLDKIIGFNPDEPFMANAQDLNRISEIPVLLDANKALLQIIDFYKSVINNIHSHKRIWKQHKDSILNLAEVIRPVLNTDTACNLLRISVQKFHRWRREVICTSSAFGLCRKLHPGQLTNDEQKTVEIYLNKPEFSYFPLINIYHNMLRDGAAYMAKETFYAYSKVFFSNRIVIRKEKQHIGIRAKSPFQIIHMDTTLFRTLDGTRVYIHFIMDNFSRVILGWKASLEAGSLNPAANLLEVCKQYDLFNKNVDLLCDDGSENKGAVSVFLERDNVLIKRIIAQIDIRSSNSMIEAANKNMKYYFLFPRKPKDFDDLLKILEASVLLYNESMPGVFYGLSRNEVLNGKIPDKHLYSIKIKEARLQRPEINRSQTCGVC